MSYTNPHAQIDATEIQLKKNPHKAFYFTSMDILCPAKEHVLMCYQ